MRKDTLLIWKRSAWGSWRDGVPPEQPCEALTTVLKPKERKWTKAKLYKVAAHCVTKFQVLLVNDAYKGYSLPSLNQYEVPQGLDGTGWTQSRASLLDVFSENQEKIQNNVKMRLIRYHNSN